MLPTKIWFCSKLYISFIVDFNLYPKQKVHDQSGSLGSVFMDRVNESVTGTSSNNNGISVCD